MQDLLSAAIAQAGDMRLMATADNVANTVGVIEAGAPETPQPYRPLPA